MNWIIHTLIPTYKPVLKTTSKIRFIVTASCPITFLAFDSPGKLTMVHFRVLHTSPWRPHMPSKVGIRGTYDSAHANAINNFDQKRNFSSFILFGKLIPIHLNDFFFWVDLFKSRVPILIKQHTVATKITWSTQLRKDSTMCTWSVHSKSVGTLDKGHGQVASPLFWNTSC